MLTVQAPTMSGSASCKMDATLRFINNPALHSDLNSSLQVEQALKILHPKQCINQLKKSVSNLSTSADPLALKQNSSNTSSMPHYCPPASSDTSLQSPSNLFMAGFQDCASEVIRFLREVEQVNQSDPLVQGLESHLTTMTKMICHETIADIDFKNSALEKQQTANEELCHLTRQKIPSLSPINLNQTHDSALDVSFVSEADLSTSVSSIRSLKLKHKRDDSNILSSTPNFSFSDSLLSSSFSSVSSQILSSSHQDVFHFDEEEDVCSPAKRRRPSQNSCTHSPSKTSTPRRLFNSLQNSVPSLAQLSQQIVTRPEDNIDSRTKCVISDNCLNLPSSTTCVSRSAQDNMPEYSFPFPHQTQDDTSVSSEPSVFLPTTPTQCLCSKSTTHQTFTSSTPKSSHSSAMNQQSSIQAGNNSSSSTVQHADESQSSNTNSSSHYCQNSDPSINSVLELKANFLPGIDTSSIASGNFGNILLAIESYQSHEDPRVREVAERLVHLIHDEDDEEEDYEYNSDEEKEDETNVAQERHVAGDFDQEENQETSQDLEWGNPVDMIEP